LKIYFKNKVIMKTNINIKKIVSSLTLITMLSTNLVFLNTTNATINKVIYPLKQVAKLNNRFIDYNNLKSSEKQNFPILNTKDYSKFIKKDWWFNEYTRRYTELWWASYKYGWDVWFGWHEGTDIVSSKWTPVYSIADWKVIVAKKALWWGYVVTVEHFMYWKKVFSNYAHMSKISVKKWQIIKAWIKVWEVWSTWNSTWNHLHLQIDLDTPFHPYYYSRKTCPYSYREITEKWVCFDDLTANTIDPLLFIETNWEILKKLNWPVNKVLVNKNPTKVYSYTKNYDKDWVSKKYSTSIWNKTVYVWYSKNDIKEVQQILIDLKLYNWKLTWNYKDIENIIFKFQVSKKILKNKSDNWAGWFWPKTRWALKKEYDKLSSKQKNINTTNNESNSKKYSSWIITKKIERKNIKTRAQIEQEEFEHFKRSYKFDFNFSSRSENIKIWSTAKIELWILKKYRKKDTYFKWATPQSITIFTDSKILKPFPKKITSFSWDWKREIFLKWLKAWVTNVKIMFWNNVIKSYKIRVYWDNEKIYLKSWMIYGKNTANAWEWLKWIALFKDKTNKRLIWVKYNWTYKIRWVWDTKICIKTWSAKYISRIYKRKCRPEEYKDEITFDYSKTVAWILLFDYKSNWWNSKVEIINTYNNATLASKSLNILAKKWTNISYVR